MQLNWQIPWRLGRKAIGAWIDDYGQSMGAALAYYTIFSLAPLLLIVISIAGLVFGVDAARGQILEQLQGLIGPEGARAVQAMLESTRETGKSSLATSIGVVVLVVGATTVFGELQNALDRIWRSPLRTPGGGLAGLWQLLRARFMSFGMIVGIGFLLMVSLVFSAALAALQSRLSPYFGARLLIGQLLGELTSLLLTAVAFALIYKILPRISVRWRDVWMGSIVTALLFEVGKYLIGLYIGRSGITSGYGAAGSLVVLMAWVYYAAQIFLIGAEFTWVYAREYGSLRGTEDASSGGENTAAAADPGRRPPAPASVADGGRISP